MKPSIAELPLFSSSANPSKDSTRSVESSVMLDSTSLPHNLFSFISKSYKDQHEMGTADEILNSCLSAKLDIPHKKRLFLLMGDLKPHSSVH